MVAFHAFGMKLIIWLNDFVNKRLSSSWCKELWAGNAIFEHENGIAITVNGER